MRRKRRENRLTLHAWRLMLGARCLLLDMFPTLAHRVQATYSTRNAYSSGSARNPHNTSPQPENKVSDSAETPPHSPTRLASARRAAQNVSPIPRRASR